MRISFLKEGTGQRVSLNQMIEENAIDLKDEKALDALIDAIGDSKYFPERLQSILHQFVVNIIAPLFFASIGLRVNFVTNFNLEVVAIILFIACFAKLIGAGVGARMSGMSKNESYAVAFGMNARGSQEIVLGTLALQAKIIDEPVFVGLVIMTIVTILIAGPLMKYYLKKHERSLPANKNPHISIVAQPEKVAG